MEEEEEEEEKRPDTELRRGDRRSTAENRKRTKPSESQAEAAVK